MSTTLEAIAAREAGAEVLGISLVTNLAAGHDRRAAQPRGGPRGRPRGGHPDGRPCSPRSLGRCDTRRHPRAGRAHPSTAPSRRHGRRRRRRRAPGLARRGPRPGHPGRAAARCSTRATRRRSPTGSAAALEFGTAGLRGELGAGPQPDEPGRRHPRRRRPRGVPRRAHGGRGRRHRLRRPPQVRRLRPRHRRGDDRCRAARAACCPARCRRRCSRSPSATSAPPPA